jgi:dipeptide/tripeptide permease
MGALLAALALEGAGRDAARGRLLTAGTLALPVALLAFAAVRWVPASLLCLVAAGGALILILNLCNSLLQTLSPDALRGRVMSVYMLAFFGFMPLGGLLAGLLAHHVGEPGAVVLCAAVTLAAAAAARILLPRLARMV